jgi:hypothetical protein
MSAIGYPLPVNAWKLRGVEQVLPVGLVVTFTDEVLTLHASVVAVKVGVKADAPGTLHATWLSAVGLDPEMKVQVRPLLHGRGPVTGYVVPPRRYWQDGTTAEHSALTAKAGAPQFSVVVYLEKSLGRIAKAVQPRDV